MGTLIPQPIIPDPVAAGNDCTICWGLDKPFGNGNTPESIVVNFSGIQKGPTWGVSDDLPINGKFTLTQIVDPKEYQLVDSGIGFAVIFLVDSTRIILRKIGFYDIFNGVTINACETLVYNYLNTRYINGSCLITIPEVL